MRIPNFSTLGVTLEPRFQAFPVYVSYVLRVLICGGGKCEKQGRPGKLKCARNARKQGRPGTKANYTPIKTIKGKGNSQRNNTELP